MDHHLAQFITNPYIHRMPREFRFRPTLFKRSPKIQWLPSHSFDIRFGRTLHHHLGWNKEEERKCKFRDRTPKPTRVCQYVGTVEGRTWGWTIYPWGCPEQELRFRKKEIEGLSPRYLARCFRKRGEKGYATTHWLIYYAMLFRPRVGRNIQICILTCRPNNPFTLRIPRGARSPSLPNACAHPRSLKLNCKSEHGEL